MDPNEALRLWSAAREKRDGDATLEHGTDLAEWLNQDGFEPKWTPAFKAEFWRWWDSTFDDTTSYHAIGCDMGEDCSCGAAAAKAPACPKCGTVMRACSIGEPDLHCDACGEVVPLDVAAECLLAELEQAGIAEAGASPEGLGESEAAIVAAAEALRRALLAHPRGADAKKALEEAECWLENHGAIYCEDEGGENEPGLARLLGLVRGALGTLRATTPLAPPPIEPGEPWAIISEDEDRADLVCGCTLTRDELGRVNWTQCADHRAANPRGYDPCDVWRCPDCGGSDVEGTAWIHLNTNKDTGSEPPLEDVWCPECEAHFSAVCCVERGTGLCTMHVEPAGEACKPKNREGEQP